jgi:hypothetical protein
MRNQKEIDWFWSGVKRKDDISCWNWTRGKSGGYGIMRWRGRYTRTHRISWEIRFGKIPEGKFVLHRWDNRTCINPAHLFIGTQQDNMADMNKKGRHGGPIGDQVFTCKLDRDKVKQILVEFYNTPKFLGKISRLSERYGVSRSTICAIVYRKIWKYVELITPASSTTELKRTGFSFRD